MFPVRRAPVRAGQSFPEGPSGLQLGESAEIMVTPSLSISAVSIGPAATSPWCDFSDGTEVLRVGGRRVQAFLHRSAIFDSYT